MNKDSILKYLFIGILFFCSCHDKKWEKVEMQIRLSGNQDKEKILSTFQNRIENSGLTLDKYEINKGGMKLLLLIPKNYDTENVKLLFSAKGLMSNHVVLEAQDIAQLDEIFGKDPIIDSLKMEIINQNNLVEAIDTHRIFSHYRYMEKSTIFPNVRLAYIPEIEEAYPFILYSTSKDGTMNFYPDKMERVFFEINDRKEFDLDISLKSQFHKELENFTAKNSPRRIAMFIDDKVVFVVRLNSIIPNGAMVLNAYNEEEKIKYLSAILNFPLTSLNVSKIECRNLDHYYPSPSQLKRFEMLKKNLVAFKKDRISYKSSNEEISSEQIQEFFLGIKKTDLPDLIRISDLDADQVDPMLNHIEGQLSYEMQKKEMLKTDQESLEIIE